MIWIGKSKAKEAKEDVLHDSLQALVKVKGVEADFIEFLDQAVILANKQTNDADKGVVAAYAQSVGSAVQLLFTLLKDGGTMAAVFAMPKLLAHMKDIESTTKQLEDRAPELTGYEDFAVSINKIGDILKSLLEQIKK